MQKWEYYMHPTKQLKYNHELLKVLNELGNEGWEVYQIRFDVGIVFCKRLFNVKQEEDKEDGYSSCVKA